MSNILITINFSNIISFLVGLGVGFLLLLLIYVYAVIRGLKKGLRKQKVEILDVDEEEIKWLIDHATKQFKNKELRKTNGFYNHLYTVSKELAFDIAAKFYPKSKYPYLELTIDETIVLSHYITNRVNELFDSKILKLFRSVTLRKLMELNDTKNKIEKTKVVKTAKKYKVSKILSNTVKVLGIINPVTWIKKLTVDQAVNFMFIKIGVSIIAITGEETYKIYSKKVFDEERTIETNVEDILKEMYEESEDL